MNGTFCVHILGSNNINRCPKSQLPMDCLLLPWLSEMKKKTKKIIYYLPKFCQEIKKIDWRYEVNIHFAQFPNTFLNTQVCNEFFSPMQETLPYKNDDIFHIFTWDQNVMWVISNIYWKIWAIVKIMFCIIFSNNARFLPTQTLNYPPF